MSAPRSSGHVKIVVVDAPDPAVARAVVDALKLLERAYVHRGQPVPLWLPGAVVGDSRPVPAISGHARSTLEQRHNRPDRPAGQQDLVDYAEAARRLSLSERTLRRRVRAGQIRHHRDGALVRFRPQDLAEYAARHTAGVLGVQGVHESRGGLPPERSREDSGPAQPVRGG